MFCNFPSFSLLVLAVSSVASARPIMNRDYGIPASFTPRASIPVTLGGVQIGLNDRGGNFDDFFGGGNFAGNLNQVTIIQQQQQLVCSSNDLRQVRQQLAVIQEFAKQIILQQVCEVEIQTVIVQQLNARFVDFGRNVRRSDGRNVAPSFDIVVAQKITEITQVISRGGNFRDLDLGFLGSEIGRNSVQIGGSNWSDATSPGSVGNAYKAARGEQEKEKQQQEKQQQEKQQQEKNSSVTPSATSTDSAAATATASSTSTEIPAASSVEATTAAASTSATESVATETPAPTKRK